MKRFKTTLCAFLLVGSLFANILGNDGLSSPPPPPPPAATSDGGFLSDITDYLVEMVISLIDDDDCPPRQCGHCPDGVPDCRPKEQNAQ